MCVFQYLVKCGQRDLTICPFPLKLFEKAVKNQVARQDSRHRGPEESRYAKHAYCLKPALLRWTKVDWPRDKNA